MALDNTTTITGNLTRDPELRYTPSGQAVVNTSVAVNRRFQDRATKEWTESTSFIDVVAWGDLAENVANSAGKGDRVTVVGRLDQRQWETPEGDKRSKIEIVADDVSASMRWATVAVTRTPSKNTSTSATASAPTAPPAYDPNEEPF